MLKAPGIKRLKLIRDHPLSNFAFGFNSRRYIVAACYLCYCGDFEFVTKALDAISSPPPAYAARLADGGEGSSGGGSGGGGGGGGGGDVFGSGSGGNGGVGSGVLAWIPLGLAKPSGCGIGLAAGISRRIVGGSYPGPPSGSSLVGRCRLPLSNPR